MKTIKTERVFVNRFSVVVAIGEWGGDAAAYDRIVDCEVVEGEVEVGMPLAAVESHVKEARRENEREERDAIRAAEHAAREKAKAEQRAKIERSIVEAVKSRHFQPGVAYESWWTDGWKVAVKAPTWTQYVRVHVDLDYSSKPRVEVGDYGDVSRFPLNRKGEFNYDRIAERITSIAQASHIAAKNKVEKETTLAQSQRVAVALREEHGISEYSSAVKVEATAYAADKVMVRIALELDAEQAGMLLECAMRIQVERAARREAEQGAVAAAEQAEVA